MVDVVDNGDRVSVHYTGSLEDGTVFDSSEGKDPLTFVAGTGQVIEGFDEAVMGKKVGEKIKITIPCEQAYGERNDELVRPLDKSAFGDTVPDAGTQIVLSTAQGQNIPAVVMDVQEDQVVVDMNHPLADKNLVFDIEIVSVEKD